MLLLPLVLGFRPRTELAPLTVSVPVEPSRAFLRPGVTVVYDAVSAGREALRRVAEAPDAPLDGWAGARTVREIGRRLDARQCPANDLDTLQGLLADSAEASDRLQGALHFLIAEHHRCTGRWGEARASWDAAAERNVRLAPVAHRLAHGSSAPTEGASLDPVRGGYGVHQRLNRVLDRIDSPERLAAVARGFAEVDPTGWLALPIERLRFEAALRAGMTREAMEQRLSWLEKNVGSRDWATQAEDWLALLPAPEVVSPVTGRPFRDIALEALGELASRGQRTEAEALVRGLVGAQVLRGDERDAIDAWIRQASRLDSRESAAAARELRALATGDGLGAALSLWTLASTDRRADRDRAALDHVLRLVRNHPAFRPHDVVAACIELAGAVEDHAARTECWEPERGLHRPADRKLDLATEAAVNALANAEFSWAATALNDAVAAVGTDWTSPVAVRARYWRGRALLLTGDADGGREELLWVREAAPLSYYGLAANRRLDPLGHAESTTRRIAALLAPRELPIPEPQALAGRELLTLGLLGQARSELMYQAELWGRHAPVTAALAAETLAARGESRAAVWHTDRSVRLWRMSQEELLKVSHRLWAAAFPVRFEREVRDASIATGAPQSRILAFMRRESGFDPDARSPVGARGLMQVMPRTARGIEERMGVAPGARSLSDPAWNTRLGAEYLAKLDRAFGGSIEMIASGYCTGPYRTEGWFKRNAWGDADLWLERVPYPIVRSYAREVAVNSTIYAVWMGEPPPCIGCRLPESIRW